MEKGAGAEGQRGQAYGHSQQTGREPDLNWLWLRLWHYKGREERGRWQGGGRKSLRPLTAN